MQQSSPVHESTPSQLDSLFHENSIFGFILAFKNGPSETWGREPLKNLRGFGLPKQTISFQIV